MVSRCILEVQHIYPRNSNLKSSNLVVHMIMFHFHPLEGNSRVQGSCFPYWSPSPQLPSHASHRERTVILSTVHQALWTKSHHWAGWVSKLHSEKWAHCSVRKLSLLLKFEHGVYTVDQLTQHLFQLIPESFRHGRAWTAEKDISQMPLQPGFCWSYTLSQTWIWSWVKWGKSGSIGCIHFPGTD